MFLAVQLPGYAQPQAIPGRCWGEEPSCTQRTGLAASAPCTPLSYSLDPRRLSPGVTLPLGTLTMSRNVGSCHNWGAPGIEWVVARDAAQPPAPHSAQVSPHREELGPDVVSTAGSDPVFTIWREERSLTAAHNRHPNKPDGQTV